MGPDLIHQVVCWTQLSAEWFSYKPNIFHRAQRSGETQLMMKWFNQCKQLQQWEGRQTAACNSTHSSRSSISLSLQLRYQRPGPISWCQSGSKCGSKNLKKKGKIWHLIFFSYLFKCNKSQWNIIRQNLTLEKLFFYTTVSYHKLSNQVLRLLYSIISLWNSILLEHDTFF